MFGNFQPNKSVIRKVTVSTPPAKKPASPAPPSSAKAAPPRPPVPNKSTSLPTSRASTPLPRVQVAPPRPRPASPSKPTPKKHVRPDELVRKAVKRKALTPPPQWDDTDDDDDSDGDSDLSFDSARKRIRSSASSVDPTPGRTLADLSHRSRDDGGVFPLAHGADLVSGAAAAKFRPVFLEEVATEIKLQYPSDSQRERFFLADSLESDGYKSMEDIVETIKYVCENYLPPREADLAGDSDTGFERRLTRALKDGSVADYTKTIDDYNALIAAHVADGSITKVLATKHAINFSWTKRILDQVYARSVSPHVELLREYKNGTDNVYGELLYPLVSDMFRETRLRQGQIFVDLGSGVGNVVLQAALEIGCEAWGCEMMRNPCDLADIQAEEFPQRTRLWGLSVGPVRLLRGDFLEQPEIGEVLKRADVVLVNNQAFGPDLNSKLVDRFLDLKEGCQVVSLKSFKPEGLELMERNMNDVRHSLRVRKLEYFSNRVSWTDAPGNYFIATKDLSELRAFQEKRSRRR